MLNAICPDSACSITAALQSMVALATRAPSGDNLQPWRFAIDAARSEICLTVNEQADLSPMNAGQRMSRIACGAALEIIFQFAQAAGWNPRIIRCDSTQILISFQIERGNHNCAHVNDCIQKRSTQRTPYDGRELSSDIVERLRSCSVEPGCRLIWITDPIAILAIAPLVARCDAMMFGNPSFLRAFLNNVRWDIDRDGAIAHGLDIRTLGLSSLERTFLPLIKKIPNVVLGSNVFRSTYYRKANALVRSSSGLVFTLSDSKSKVNDFDVGRVMQRAWLTLTAAGLSAQPMMSLPVLAGSTECRELHESQIALAVIQMHNELKTLISAEPEYRIASILRYGYPSRASIRSGRLPIDQIVTETPSN